MNTHAYSTIECGAIISRKYRITAEIYESFLSVFGDKNPLHSDAVFAKKLGFSDKVMHGAILNGFISHFVGMHYPGEHSVLHSVSLEYRKPNYLNDEILIEATIDQKVDSLKVLIMKMRLTNLTQNYLCASGTVQVGLTQ